MRKGAAGGCFLPEVDAYIERRAEFARPILQRIRKVIHQACPEVVEVIKWGAPHFEYHGLLVGLAAFKQHVNVIFWKGRLMEDPQGLFRSAGDSSMTGLRVEDVSELPADRVLAQYVKRAMALNAAGAKVPRARAVRHDPEELEVPDYFRAALKKNKKAQATFEGFSYSHRKEYVQWVDQAKREETRQRRLATAMEQMTEGKPHNWKYMRR